MFLNNAFESMKKFHNADSQDGLFLASASSLVDVADMRRVFFGQFHIQIWQKVDKTSDFLKQSALKGHWKKAISYFYE